VPGNALTTSKRTTMAHDPLSRKHFLKMAGWAGGASLLAGKVLQPGTVSAAPDRILSPDPYAVTVDDTGSGDTPLIIDANVGLGRFSYGLNADLSITDRSVEYMRAAGVSRALAYSVLARQTDAPEGNAMVLEAANSHKELIPSCVITPYEMPTDELINGMNRENIRVARLFPVSGHFSVHPSVIGTLAEKLQHSGKVLFIDFESLDWNGRTINYEAVSQLCKAFPDLPVVLIGSTIVGSRNYPNLLMACPNLHLEISQIFQPGGIRKLVDQGYGHRLIFGSAFPEREPGALLHMLAHSGLNSQETADICSGNLLRLLGQRAPTGGFTLQKPSSHRIIDMHVHQGTYQSAIGMESPEQTVRSMDRSGVDVVVASSLWSCFGEVARGNQAVSDGTAQFPGRYFGYLTVDPKYPDEVRSEIERHGENPAFRGFKLHLMLHELTIDDPRNEMIYTYANRKGWPLLIHGDGSLEAWEHLCTTWPNAQFIKAHIGGSDPQFNDETTGFARLAARMNNLYLDCGFSRIFPGALDRLAAITGAEKLLFGSDYPMFEFAFQAGRVTASSLTEREKVLIFSGNAARLLRL